MVAEFVEEGDVLALVVREVGIPESRNARLGACVVFREADQNREVLERFGSGVAAHLQLDRMAEVGHRQVVGGAGGRKRGEAQHGGEKGCSNRFLHVLLQRVFLGF